MSYSILIASYYALCRSTVRSAFPAENPEAADSMQDKDSGQGTAYDSSSIEWWF